MINTKEVKIRITDDLSSKYIENCLNGMGYNVISWAITAKDKETFTLNVAVVENFS